MHIMKYILPLLVLGLLIACGGPAKKPADEALLQEAAKYHMDALDVEKKFKSIAKKLESNAAEIQIQGRALDGDEQKWLEEYHGIMRGYELWSENHIEVPGHEHEHDHSHDGHDHHHHHHHSDVQLTPQDMMETQKAFLDNINDLKTKAEKLLR